jgi:hypothetical protein
MKVGRVGGRKQRSAAIPWAFLYELFNPPMVVLATLAVVLGVVLGISGWQLLLLPGRRTTWGDMERSAPSDADAAPEDRPPARHRIELRAVDDGANVVGLCDLRRHGGDRDPLGLSC